MRRHARIVYFLRCDDAVKIGTTTHLSTRVPMIERDIGAKVELLGWVYGRFETEKLIHHRLAEFDEGNEWFRASPEVLDLITFVLAKGPIFYGLPPIGSPAKRRG